MSQEGIRIPEGVYDQKESKDLRESEDQKDSVTERILRQRYPSRKSGFWGNQLRIRPIHSNLSP
ncbi:UNVERIFIED_CONTAM: hypothetical protein Sradi_3286100 [Sesamum radiatum]|uniref:Uncharacterized protein n=1 Tax=Sesamum radiatum TaxID=300843 RepID=A0AAW2R0W2_SESRA